VGYSAGTDIGTALAYDASYEIGFVTAIEQNTEKGYEDGFREGLSQGVLQASTQAFEAELQNARDEGKTIGIEQGTLAGIKTVVNTYLVNNRFQVQAELEKENYVCNSSNICEFTIFNNTSTGERRWNVFNLNTMTHTLNSHYISNDESQMKQRIIIDYSNGEISAEWRLRSEDYTTPILLYSWIKAEMVVNNSEDTNQEQLEFMLDWYSDVRHITSNAGVSWVLAANRG
jgi:hypothetical protein